MKRLHHSFITTFENITMKVSGEFDFEGDYEIEEVIVDQTDIYPLLSTNAKHFIDLEAERTLKHEIKQIEMEGTKYGSRYTI